jgi:hypothetical protein
MPNQTPSPRFAALRKQLRARAESLRAEVQQHRHQLVEPAAATSNTFIAGAEGAAADADDALEVALLGRAQGELDAVTAALQRIDRAVAPPSRRRACKHFPRLGCAWTANTIRSTPERTPSAAQHAVARRARVRRDRQDQRRRRRR